MASLKVSKKKSQEDSLRETAKQIAREAVMEMQKEEDEGPSDDLFTELDASNDPQVTFQSNVVDDPMQFDLFDHCDALQRAGTIIQYTIKKNNVLIASGVNHPTSWEQIMKKYGEGVYQVIAKNIATKKFIKSQTQVLGSGQLEDTKHEEESETQSSQPNFLEIMALLDKKSQEARREAREEALRMSEMQEKQQTTMLTLITALVQGGQNKGPSTAEIQLQTMQMMTGLLDKMQMNTNQMIEKLANRIEKVGELATQKKDDGLNWTEVMKLTAEAQNKGFDMWSKLEEMAERKAEEKIDLIEEYRTDDKEERSEEKESATDKLIKTILPSIAAALTNKVTAPAQPQMDPRIARQRQLEAQRRDQIRLQNEKRKADLTHVMTSNAPPTGIVDGLPRVSFADDTLEASSVGINQENPIKEKCLDVLPPFIGQLMIAASNGELDNEQAAEAAINFLMEQGISREVFLANVESQDLINVAEGYNLPDEAKSWLNLLYANIQTFNRAETRGESSANLG